jgi:hypothetical protein
MTRTRRLLTSFAVLPLAAAAAFTLAPPAVAADGLGVDLPSSVFPGSRFPVPETIINAWIDKNHDHEIYEHGWGLWAGLTLNSGRTARGVEDAPIYLTWASPSELADASVSTKRFNAQEQPLLLQAPRQFHRGKRQLKSGPAQRGNTCNGGRADACIQVTVNYSPSAARHVLNNGLLLERTLNQYFESGYTDIPNFPYDALTVKPVYKVITPEKSPKGEPYAMPVWPGTPQPAKTFGETDWNQCVYISLDNTGEGKGEVDKGCQEATPATTYDIDDFIHFKVTETDAHYLADLTGEPEGALKVGDTIILVAMHVGTREIKRWTWQTFWWTPDPAAPHAPSSRDIALARPDQMQSPASHYAMAIGYQMLDPVQPLTGGENYGNLVPVYNPYLEAGFDPGVFAVSRPVVTLDEGLVATRYGVETNCQTCHGLASYDPASLRAETQFDPEKPYGANFYLPIDDPIFDGTLKLDFAWSILGTMKKLDAD